MCRSGCSLHHALWDCWVHERDIALPLGMSAVPEPDEVRSCLRYAAARSPALAISSGTALEGVFAVAATDPDLDLVLEIGETVAGGMAWPRLTCRACAAPPWTWSKH